METEAIQEDFEKRLAEEVGHLSTKLVTAVNKQVELEETVLQLRKQLHALNERNKALIKSEESYKLILPKYIELQDEYKEVNIKKQVAETENKKLKGEVEDLTASLFDEANTMVSNASRETHNFKVKNRKLYEEIDEKNIIISNLQEQLQDLKQMFLKIEDQQRLMQHTATTAVSTPQNEEDSQFDKSEGETMATTDDNDHSNKFQLQQILADTLYSPQIMAMRFDLNNFNKDFKGFVYTLIKPDFQLDLTHLKNLIYFKNIWSDEIENAMTYIPSLPQTTILNRWQKSKIFWGCLIDGRVSIEPIKGFHEHLKTNGNNKVSDDLLSIAIREPCSFCGEFRSENYSHCRLHYYKMYEIDEGIVASYPLCNFCVIKLRNLCDFFAKVRLIKSNIFKLQQNNAFEEYAHVPTATSNFYKRSNSSSHTMTTNVLSMTSTSTTASVTTNVSNTASAQPPPPASDFINGHVHGIELDENEESKLIKIYLMLTLIRLKIFWSKLGIWDNIDQINEINLDGINYEIFIHLLPDSKRKKVHHSVPTTPRQFERQRTVGDVARSNERSPHKVESNKDSFSATEEYSKTSQEEEEEERQQKGKKSVVENDVSKPSTETRVSSLSRPKNVQDRINSLNAQANQKPVQPTISSDTTRIVGTANTPNARRGADSVPQPRNKVEVPIITAIDDNGQTEESSDASAQSSSTECSKKGKQGQNKKNGGGTDVSSELTRAKSKSKSFKEKMDKDLNETLEMLAENLESSNVI